MTDGLKDEHREAIIAAIAANDRVERAVLFGSRATGTNTVSSDVDIALFGERLTLTDQARLAAALGETPMAQSVDLLLYDSTLDRTLQEHIRRQGVEWYVRSSDTKAASQARRRSTDEEWKNVALGNLAEVFDGPHATPTKTPTGPLFLGISNLASGRLDLTATEHLSDDDFLRWTRRVTPTTDDVVFSYETRIGEAALIPKGLRACLGRRMGLLRPRDGTVDPRFLLYAFLGPQFQETLRARTVHGSTVDRIPLIEMPRFPIRVPRNIAEQRAIAHILGTLDDKVELNRRMSATLEAMARALFKSWFVDFYPVRSKMKGGDAGMSKQIADLFPCRLVKSEIGEVPSGWDVVPLGDIIDVNPARRLRKGQTAPYLDMANMPTTGHTPYSIIDRPYGSGMRFTNGDTLLARITPCLENGKTAYVDFLQPGAIGWGSTEYLVMRPRPPLPAEFAYCLARSPRFREFLITNMSGTSGRQRVPAQALSQFMCISPSELVAQAFEKIVQPVMRRSNVAARESSRLSRLRDTLLLRLIAGELRINRFTEETA